MAQRPAEKIELLWSGSKNGACPALYHAPERGAYVVQGDRADDSGAAVVVPHALLDGARPGTQLLIETTARPGCVLVRGEPVPSDIRPRLTLDPHETAVVVPCER